MTVEELAREVLENLEGAGCIFWACPGPDEPFEDMATCRICATIQTAKEALAELRHDQALPAEGVLMEMCVYCGVRPWGFGYCGEECEVCAHAHAIENGHEPLVTDD